MDIKWLEPFVHAWRDRVCQARVPHAVLLLGPAGVGKRSAAAWLARERLGLSGTDRLPQYPLELPEHADLRWIRPPDDKQSIGIEQIRELVAGLALTSYSGGGKVAVVEPANAMTDSAANSLLKTLEEPAGDALIVLVADRVGRLPATIVSRCQRISLGLPAPGQSLEWLESLDSQEDWPQALKLAGLAPLAAVEARGDIEQAMAMSQAFTAIAERAASPVDVAASWSKLDAAFVLDWLSRTVQDCILRANGLRDDARQDGPADSVLRRIDRRNLFCYLDIINRLRGAGSGQF